MNLISGVLLTLWVAGWAVAAVRAVRKARVSAPDGPITSQLTRDNVSGEKIMIMIRSVVRPEKVDTVLAALMDAGFRGHQDECGGPGQAAGHQDRGDHTSKSPRNCCSR